MEVGGKCLATDYSTRLRGCCSDRKLISHSAQRRKEARLQDSDAASYILIFNVVSFHLNGLMERTDETINIRTTDISFLVPFSNSTVGVRSGIPVIPLDEFHGREDGIWSLLSWTGTVELEPLSLPETRNLVNPIVN